MDSLVGKERKGDELESKTKRVESQCVKIKSAEEMEQRCAGICSQGTVWVMKT